jgi:hypothetical protein
LEYNDDIVSDHRGLYVDLDPVSIFGGMTDDPVSASSCGFTSKNEKKTEKYLNELKKYFKDHKICKWNSQACGGSWIHYVKADQMPI